MDYIGFWTGFQKRISENKRIQEVLDDTRNESGRGKDKNSFVFSLREGEAYEKKPYEIIALVNTRSAFISVDAYFKKKAKHGEETLDFFLNHKNELQNRIGHDLYVSDVNKGEVRISLRKPIFEFDVDKSDEYYDWLMENLLNMYDSFEGLRAKEAFYPERQA